MAIPVGGFYVPTRFDAQMELPPGDYYLRVVVSDGKKRYAIARLPLHVDTFNGQQLATYIHELKHSLSNFCLNT